MKFKLFLTLALFLFPLWAIGDSDEPTPISSSDKLVTLGGPTPEPTPTPSKITVRRPDSSKALVIHKPMPSPSWGKVIQYHRETNFAFSEKNREILHEFLFQDDDGVVRTAIFHEDSSGEGYWEVWVWDQP